MTEAVLGIMTNAGTQYIADKTLANQGLEVAEVVLANINSIDENTPRDPAEGLPTELQIMHRRDIDAAGKVDENTVAWSVVLDQNVGDFDYNWIGLVATDGTLIAVDYLPLQRKRAGVNNVHNRSFVLQFAGAAALAQITIPAESWMFDYTPRIDALELGLLECTQRIESVEQALAEPSQPEVDPGGAAEMTMVDDQGNTNVMVRVPKFSYQDVNQSILDRTGVDLQLGTGTPTMFLKNGVEINEVYIAKYLASAGASGGCSVVGDAAPMTNVDYDTAKALCKNKGAGWHMMSIHEWAAVALWSFANGTEPRGNTDYGRSHESTIETAVRVDNKTPGDRSGTGATKTGTGPQAWSHDGTSLGIADLVGNVYEWLDQMSLIEGQITTTLDNDPDAAEQSWVKHSAFLDSQTASKSGSAGSPVLNSAISNRNGSVGDDTSNGGYATNEHFAKIAQSPTYQKMELLRRLVIESASQTNVKGSIYCRNYGARFPLRGGHWYIGSDAGLGALTLIYARSGAHSVFGFRPAFFA